MAEHLLTMTFLSLASPRDIHLQFKQELAEKTAKLDTDPGLWMALTLAKESYTTLLAAKKTPPEQSGPHFDRMQAMLKAFRAQVCVRRCGRGDRLAPGPCTDRWINVWMNARPISTPPTHTHTQPGSAGMGLFGAVDIGQGAYWWDYGQLKLYFANSIRVTEASLPSSLLFPLLVSTLPGLISTSIPSILSDGRRVGRVPGLPGRALHPPPRRPRARRLGR